MKLSSEQLEWIQSKAVELGFLECKAVPLKEDPNYSAYENWIEEGHHKPLDYLARNNEFRKRPSQLGNNLQSAFVFLHPYPREFESKWVARYAWGKDYHHTMKSKLFQLSEFFETKFKLKFEQRICVDTAPVLERSLAQQSGLGWVAKNGCLISREHGSFFMIGCWLLSFEVELEPQISGFHCGKCTRCLDACPTDAFIKPGFLEIDKCLSAATIENRSEINSNFIKHLDQQVFGCDICQIVCPWNKKHVYEPQQEALPPLKELLSIPESNFRDYFRKTALERPGWIGLRRNFLIAAVHDESVPDNLFMEHLTHEKELIRNTARQCLEFRQST